jgi:hypothetical protein
MHATMTDLLVLATEGAEGVPAEHIASKIAVPLGILIFCGSVFALLWSNYGAKKGALIYSTAFFGFTFMLGIFWWFGAPGTPVATGVQNFPGQAADAYAAHWYAFEPGSPTAEYLPATNSLDDFVTIEEFLGTDSGPGYTALVGDVAQAGDLMTQLALRTDDTGQSQLGGQARAELQEAGEQGLVAEVGEDAADEFSRADPFFTGEAGELLVTRTSGVFTAGTEVTMQVNYVNEDGETVTVPAGTRTMFAFKQESALWFPSAVWTGISFVLFALSLFGLDRIEQREKRREEEIDEPEDLAVPIRQ